MMVALSSEPEASASTSKVTSVPGASARPCVLKFWTWCRSSTVSSLSASSPSRAMDTRLWQPQEGDEALLNCIERIIWVEAALASIGEQPLAVRVDELCDPPEEPGRRVETAVSCLLFVRCLVFLEQRSVRAAVILLL